MGEGPAEELARADAMVREADDMEKQASALRRQARQIRAKHAGWRDPALIQALNKAMDGKNGNDP